MAITRPASRRPAWPRRAAPACAAAAALPIPAGAPAGLRAAGRDGEPIAPVPPPPAAAAVLVALGEALFGDARLPGSGRLGCAFCRDLGTSGASGRAHGTGEDAVSSMARAQLGRELSAGRTAGIVAFLGTLTGRLNGRPVRPAR
jgi:cytochrome c peroxidase